MKKDDPQFRLRVPDEMHALLADAAKKNRRSINAEIVARLQGSLEADAASVHQPPFQPQQMRDEILAAIGGLADALASK